MNTNIHQKRSGSRKSQQKNSGRNSKREFELSSKREYLDLCQSPTGVVVSALEQEDNTLERASNQDDILGTGGEAAKEAAKRRKSRIVSDFNPGPLPVDEILV